jgi:hypothetical protein
LDAGRQTVRQLLEILPSHFRLKEGELIGPTVPAVHPPRCRGDQYVPEDRQAVRSVLAKAQNFFKHTTRDATETFFFLPSQSEVMLVDACFAYREIAQEQSHAMWTFLLWAHLTFGEAFVKFPLGSPILEQRDLLKGAASKGRKAFFQQFLSIAQGLK